MCIRDSLVDGQPFRASAKLKANLEISGENILHRMLIGTEWSMDKNYGRGQAFVNELCYEVVEVGSLFFF